MRPFARDCPKRSVPVLCALAGVVIFCGVVTAQPVSTPATVSTPSAVAMMNPAAKAVVDRSLAAYSALSTYGDTMVHRFDFRANIGGKSENQSVTQTPRFRYAKPNKFVIIGVPLEMTSDGRVLWLRSQELSEYVQRPLSSGQRLSDAAAEFADMLSSHPVMEILSGSTQTATGFPGFDQLIGVSKAALNGRTVDLVQGRRIEPQTGATIHTRAWFDAETALLAKMELDLRESYEGAYAGAPPNQQMTLEQALITIDFTEVRTNETFTESTFVFAPGEKDRKVDGFTPALDDIQDPKQLVGRPAPAFVATVLGGGELDLSQFKGKVVVLDFWATWCAPCIRMLPSVNKLVDQYKEQPVVILGVNTNVSADMEKVKRFVTERKVDAMRHVLDPGGTIGRDYAAQAIPLTVMIDREGIVRYVHSGFEPDVAASYGAKIDKLIKGEPIDP